MSVICNKQESRLFPLDEETSELYARVDAPIATGSAHLMRAGAELHLLHSDLELNDLRQATVRVSCAAAAVKAALVEYESSHSIARELGFYAVHDEVLRAAGGGSLRVRETLEEASGLGLVALDSESLGVIARRFVAGGDEAAFGHFLSELREFSAELDLFDRTAASADLSAWQQFPWKAITQFDRIRIYGQALAIINILGTAGTSVAVNS
ncbi:hypothetical protein [Streptomyces sp. WM6378]|uniref:hypothetical protein n=1 Tax=Streptomyces sp. WM6378 TaxID=1415557 RepID=UPI0006B05551|nr:hypothetical protein [Streptomyces sp. WM6378]KOU51861.1 hypothetical protein ADK54_08655 [Streptomyces sp. WM6378]